MLTTPGFTGGCCIPQCFGNELILDMDKSNLLQLIMHFNYFSFFNLYSWFGFIFKPAARGEG
jgi:hypothetical protein